MEGKMVSIDAKLRSFMEALESYEAPSIEDDVTHLREILGLWPSIETVKALLAVVQAEHDRIIDDDIPMLLAENGLKEAKLEDGTKVGTELFYETKTVDKDKMIEWLKSIGAGDLVKDTLSFGAGVADDALYEFLRAKGYSYSQDRGVHGQSLKKAVRDWMEEGGDPPPEDAVVVKPFVRAKITYPKKPL